MERDPWWLHVPGPLPVWKGPKGVKPDGGGSIRGQGRVGRMLLHRATFNRNKDGARRSVVCVCRGCCAGRLCDVCGGGVEKGGQGGKREVTKARG